MSDYQDNRATATNAKKDGEGSVNTVQSTESSLKVIDAKTRQVLLQLENAFDDDKVKIDDEMEDLDEELQLSTDLNHKMTLTLQKEKLAKKLFRLERDYTKRCEFVKRKAEADKELVRVENEDAVYYDAGAVQNVTTNDDAVDKVTTWMDNRVPVTASPPENYPPPQFAQNGYEQQQPTEGAPQPPHDKDAMMMALIQTQLNILQDKTASASEKVLPEFGGDPAKWGTFKSAFDRSQARFRFDNSANLGRLQQALKGEIMRILNMRFGNPEIVLEWLADKARACRRPDPAKPETVVEFGTAVHALVTNVVSYNKPAYMFNVQLINDLVAKLPVSMQESWTDYRIVNKITDVDLRQLSGWLNVKMESALLRMKLTCGSSSDGKQEEKSNRSRRNVGQVNAASGEEKDEKRPCQACKKRGHSLHSCWSLKKMTTDDLWKIVKTAIVCFCCLQEGHSKQNCPDARECGRDGCKDKHHPLLDFDKKNGSPVLNARAKGRKSDEDGDSDGTVGLAVSFVKGTDGPLPIVPVRLKSKNGTRLTYAMLDSGATRTLISQNLATELELTGPKKNYRYRTMSGEIVECKQSMEVNMEIAGRFKSAKYFPLTDVVTVKNIGLAPYSIDVEGMKRKWPHLRRYKGPSLNDVTPELIVVGDHGDLMMHRDLLYQTIEDPVAMRTVLGWILQGKLKDSNQVGSTFHIGGVSLDDALTKLIEESFKLDECSSRNDDSLCLSRQDKKAMEILESTTRQRDDGRWETGLLWKDDEPFSSKTYDESLSRLVKTDCRMERNGDLAKVYPKKITEYLEKGYIRKLTEEEASQVTGRTCHIPHFGVTNPHKPGKFRLVFDCAAKIEGRSFNDFLLTGPDLIKPLTTILWNFRVHPVVICGDIEDMFHRIFIRKEDQQAQRFLWRDGDRSWKPDVYEVMVMIFGATSSPSCAIYVKDRNAERFREKYPEAVDAITNSMYVDDNLCGSQTVADAIRLRKEITDINAAGGFTIKKWISNSQEVMESIPEELRLTGDKPLAERGIGETERVLGLYWDPNEDNFTFRLNFAKVKANILAGEKPTKREMCSLIMSLFDPLGFVGHFKIKGLILFQEVWKSGVGWDDYITDDVYEEWKVWLHQMKELPNMKIPRCYSGSLSRANVQLHCLVDASAQAISGVCYLRIEQGENVEVSFVGSKVRVAPTKKTTIPRLELCAALVGAQLATSIMKELRIKIDDCVFWSDSSTVLYWIASESARFKEYVANRVTKIQLLTGSYRWRWVDTANNVADDATRSRMNADLTSDSRWLRGPDFLKKPEAEWPVRNGNEVGSVSSAMSEESDGDNSASRAKMDLETVPKWNRFSSYHRLLRSTAAVSVAARFWLSKARKVPAVVIPPWQITKEEIVSNITADDVMEAEKRILRAVQHEGNVVSWCHKKKLKIVTDAEDIVRVSGRLERASHMPEEAKMPIVLPGGHRVVVLIVDQEHQKNGHCGRGTVFNNLRQKYWIPEGRQAVRKSWSRCYVCKIRKAKPVVPEMGMLPSYRMAAYDPPFTYTGTDLFGPAEVTVGRHHEKRWGILFTCMVTRSLHLEVLSGLSTDETLMGISRFVDSRGLPRHFYSDNGTNFRSAAKEIEKRQKFYGTTWHFIPPASPHMGGAWETLVKQVKTVLDDLLKEKYPRDQTLLTALKAVENIVNSRPLSYVSDDHGDPVSLTPNHFLRGVGVASQGATNQLAVSGSQFLGSDISDEAERWGKQWQKAQFIAKRFWERWNKEVLPDLLIRNKWNSMKEGIVVGDIVLMVDEQRPRGEWSKAIVTKTCPGADGIVRVVEVTTRNFATRTATKYKRAVAKLCPIGVRCGDLATVPDDQIRGPEMVEISEEKKSDCDAGKLGTRDSCSDASERSKFATDDVCKNASTHCKKRSEAAVRKNRPLRSKK